MIPTKREPTRPGEILKDIIDETDGLTQEKLADKMGMSVQTVNLIINGKRAITAETAIRLARVFDMSPQFWLNAQNTVDLWHAQRKLEAR